MDHLEKVEELVAKTGCSYADAKAALEQSDWNMLDAIIVLEQGGKAEKSSASFSTDRASEASYTVIPTVSESGSAGSGRNAGSAKEGKTRAGKSKFLDSCKNFFIKAMQVLTENFVNVYSRNGNQLLHLPIWAALIPLLAWFWGTIIVCLISMVFGCRFHFEGRDFGKTTINDSMDRASTIAYNAGQKVREEFSGNSGKPSESGAQDDVNEGKDTDH